MPSKPAGAYERWILVVLGLAALFALWRVAHRQARADHDRPGVPVELAAGQQAALETILGRGATLPEGCSYAGATFEAQRFEGRYTCPGRVGPLVIEFVTGADARRLTETTQRFGVVTAEGFPPSLRAFVSARMRARENQLQWQLRTGADEPAAHTESTRARLARVHAPSLREVFTRDPLPPLALALGFLLVLVVRIARRESLAVRCGLVAVVAAGALLRLTLSLDAPMNAHSFSRVIPLAMAMHRGPLLEWFSSVTDAPIYFVDVQSWLNYALASLTPLAFFAHARLLLGSGRRALAAAALMALLPMHLRFSRSDVGFISSLLWSSLTFASLYGSLTDPSRAWRVACRVALPAFSLATYLARPENMIFVGLDLGALALYARAEVPRRRVAIAAALIAATALWSATHDLLVNYRQNVAEGLDLATLAQASKILVDLRFNTLVNPWTTAPLLPFFAALGALTLWREGERRRVIFLVLWLSAFFVVHSYVRPDQVAMQARYHLHLVSPFLLLAAAATPRVLSAPAAIRAAVGAWIALMPLLHRGFIRDVSFTEMREYALLRGARAHLAPQCTVLEFSPAFDLPGARYSLAPRTSRMSLALRRGFVAGSQTRQIGILLPGATGLDAREVYALPDDFTAPPCLYYYEGAACTTHRPVPGRLAEPCEEVRRRFALTPVIESSHTLRAYDSIIVSRAFSASGATPLVTRIINDGPTVHLGLYRVTGLRH